MTLNAVSAASLAALLALAPAGQALAQTVKSTNQPIITNGPEAQAGRGVPVGQARPAQVEVPRRATVSSRRATMKAKPKPAVRPSQARGRPVLAKVAAANAAALVAPLANGNFNAIQLYPFSDGALFQVFCAPERVSDVILEEGEALISISAGDTARWMVADTTSGGAGQKRVHVLIKPLSAGLRTNLIINTDRRSYHLALESTASTAMAAVSFRYATGMLVTASAPLQSEVQNLESPAQERGQGTGSPEALNFDYIIEGDHPPWRPLRVYDDGRRLYIGFPKPSGDVQAPPLYAVTPDGCLELINYQVRGAVYVVDHMVDALQLRAGERRQEVVRILRSGSRPPAKACRS